MALIPHDILREIGAYWNGHRLHYTCAALHASWNPDNYVITGRNEFTEELIHLANVIINTTIKYMPNGAHHGESVSVNYHPWNNTTSTEIMEYDRGVLMSVNFQAPRFYTRAVIVNGRAVNWASDRAAHILADLHNTCGDVVISRDCLRRNVPFRDFIAVAIELTARMPRPYIDDIIPIRTCWGRQMPGARQ